MKKQMVKRIGLLAIVAVFSLACAFTSLAAKTRLSTPDDLYWSSTSKDNDEDYDEGSYAKWDEVEHATKYEVTLYREDDNGSTSTVKTVTTKSNKYNFRSLMDKEGDYYFKVRAQSSKSDYSTSLWSSKSDTYYVSASAAENVANGDYVESGSATAVIVSRDPGWTQNEYGMYYQRSDGTYPANGWFQDPDTNSWFCLDENGYVRTGFIEDGENLFYCDPAAAQYGAMATGSVLYDGVVYNFDENGVLVSTEDGIDLEEE